MNPIDNGTPESEEATLEKMRTEHKEAQETLEANVDKTLAKLRGNDTSIPEPEPKPDPEPGPEPEPEPDPQLKTEPEPDPQPEPKPAGNEPEPKPADDKPVLTPAEIRAAMRMEWSEEDIKELAQTNPDLAKKTCANALKGHNSLSKKLAESGKAQATKPAETISTPVAPVVTGPKSIDFTALEAQYEGDPIVGVLKQVVDQSQAQATELAALKADGGTKVSQAQVQQDAAVSQQIDTFFAKPDVAVYKDTYGVVEKGSRDWDGLTQGQIKKRYEVVEQANYIALGAKQQGMDMPLEEAFERAHLVVTEGAREQTIRKDIKAKAEKRSKSLTLAPTGAVKVPDSGKKTLAKAVTNAGPLLAKLRKGR